MEKKKNQQAIVEVRQVTKEYQSGDKPFLALKKVELDVWRGEFLGITGKSGAGKTTLLNMISGVSRPTSGEIRYFGGQDGSYMGIHALNEDALARWRGENLGIVYQSFELMPSLNLIDNVMLPLDFLGDFNPQTSRERALELLKLVEIAEHAHKIPAHISGGQKQRVAIARALVNDPPLIVADEPTGNLDTVTAETILQIFEKLVARGKTIIMVTHDESLAPRFSRRLQLFDGEIGRPPTNGNRRSRTRHFAPSHNAGAGQTSALSPAAIHANGKNGRQSGSNGRPKDVPAILLKGVEKVYENAAGRFKALKSIDLQLEYGQFISVVGKSGSGKSTLINMITGIDHPTAGSVIVGADDIYQMSESQRALWRGKNLGVVFQFFQLLPTLSLLENTMLPMDYCNVYNRHERPRRAMDLLKQVGLEEQAHQLPSSVSSGQQQSAAIARALATDPSIILADEPTGNLDSHSAGVILDLFERLAQQGKTIIIVTHDPAITQRSDKTVILSDGEIIDPTVARALPTLTYPQMLNASHQTQKQVFSPSTVILAEGDSVEHFFMVAEGEVDILLPQDHHEVQRLARLGPGGHFGEVELIRGGKSIALVRAASETQVEVALLSKDSFQEILEGSSQTRQLLHDTALTRQTENRNSRRSAC